MLTVEQQCSSKRFLFLLLALHCQCEFTAAFLFYPRGGSLGYLAAVAMPLDLPHRNVYVAFNFEANYGTPPNSTYVEWVERWDLAQNKFGIGNNVTGIDGRQQQQDNNRYRRYTRNAFYSSFIGYAKHFELNGWPCLLRTICEVTATVDLDEHNGLLGSLFKILFMPSTSMPEPELELTLQQHHHNHHHHHQQQTLQQQPMIDGRAKKRPQLVPLLYEAEFNGRNANCSQYMQQCPQGILDMISAWI